ncbi:hypothetical protein [Endobacterium cereale]|uniref:hypothetical protein n=1 Tax=Endobacterium cereale TaxID=2663029 RepID=UPI002B478250|nr:hypothetical protein [Endobacterium cereale]MEB2845888.1 hypothetical protein [Endobacterium cereale]
MTERCDCEFFEFGDRVRSVQNPHLSGQIIGEKNWGDEYLVRLADGASTIWWHFVEIEHDPDGNPPAAKDDDTNVVRVDFTKPREMDENTTTGGAA